MKAWNITSSALAVFALSVSVLGTASASQLTDNVMLRACERAASKSQSVQERLLVRLQQRGYTCAALAASLELGQEADENTEEAVDSPEEQALEKAVSESLAPEMTDITMTEAKRIAVKYFNDHGLSGSNRMTEAGREIKFGQPSYVFEFNEGPNEFDLIFSSKGEYLGTEY